MKKNKNIKHSQIKKKSTQSTNKKKVRKNKFKRLHKGKMNKITHSFKSGKLTMGLYGVMLIKPTWLDEKKLGLGQKLLRKYLRKKDFLWTRIFPDVPVTKKPTGIRMGKGKGKPISWVSKVQAGTIIFEFSGLKTEKLGKLMHNLSNKWTHSFRIIKDNLIKLK